MKNKKIILVFLLLLAIGFAAVSTNLFINGSVNYSTNKDDFDVYFSGAELDNVDVSNEVIKDKKHIEYTSNELKTLNDTSVLKYEVTNNSRNYDATVTISCTPMKTDYIEVSLIPVTFDIDAGEIKTGEIEAKLIKVSETEQNINIDCELDVKAVERTELGDTNAVSTYELSGELVDEDNNQLSFSELVMFSEKRLIRTSETGKFYINGVERGTHHIYYYDGEEEIEYTEEALKDYLIAEVTTSGQIKMINNKYKINNYKTTKTTNEFTCADMIGIPQDFSYNGTDGSDGSGQEFNVKNCSGTYKIELWGGSYVGFGVKPSQLGGYVSGKINLNSHEKLYVYIGSKGTPDSGGFNGGGSGRKISTLGYHFGGGATDIRLEANEDELNISSLKSRIMVASGSGSAPGGGLTGYAGTNKNYVTYSAYGGTQTSGGTVTNYTGCNYRQYYPGTNGSFGKGGTGGNANEDGGGKGGGGGWYGGAGSSALCNDFFESGGGASYISGHAGSIAIEYTTDDTINIKNGCTSTSKSVECSIHYSNKVFTDTVMIDGKGCIWNTDVTNQCDGIPDYNGYNKVLSNPTDGHARITLISLD